MIQSSFNENVLLPNVTQPTPVTITILNLQKVFLTVAMCMTVDFFLLIVV